MCVCMHVFIARAHVCVSVSVCVTVCMRVCVCTSSCVCVHTCVHAYVWTVCIILYNMFICVKYLHISLLHSVPMCIVYMNYVR